MLSIALATLRTRWVSLAGACLAAVLGTGFVAVMLMSLSAATATPFPGPQRFAAAPIVVVPSKTEQFTGLGLAAPQPGGVPVAVVARLARTGPVVADRTFPAQQDGAAPGQVGHPWSAAVFTPYRLVAGHRPMTGSEIVIGGGSPGLVGRQVTVTTAASTRAYIVAGVTAPVWFEQAIFFSDTTAASIDPQIDAVVAYGPPGAVRQAASGGTRVLIGAARKTADPDPSGGKNQLSNASAAAGTSTALGIFVVVFVVLATFAFVTGQRRREIGLLRAIGAAPRQIRRMIRIEAAVIGVAASAVGCALAPLAIAPVTTWMIDHGVAPIWFTIHVAALPLIIAFAIGLAGVMVGSTAASWRAARVRPIEALRDAAVDDRVMSVARWLIGVGLLAIGTYLGITTIIRDPGTAMIVKDYLPVFVPIVAGFALLAPAILKPVTLIATWPLRRMGAGSMVVRQNVLTGGRRTAATVAPIVLAVGLAGAMLTVEAVATATYDATMHRETRAQFVVRSTGTAGLSAPTIAAIRAVPDTAVAVFTSVPINVASASGAYIDSFDARAVDPAGLAATQNFTPMAGSLADLGSDFLIVDERTARADGLHAGETVKAYLPDGSSVPLRIAAVIRTGVTAPTVYLPAEDAAGDPPSQVDVAVRAPATPAGVRTALQAALGGDRAVVTPIGPYLQAARSQLTQHDRQATEVILGLALIYALIAVANTVVMATSGRRREIAALSLAGATRRQVLRFIGAESVLVASIGAILSAGATAVVVAAQWGALTRFSADVRLSIPWMPILAILAVAGGVAGLTSVLSAWWVLRASAVELADVRE